MAHIAISQIEKRIEAAKQDSDFAYFHALLLEGEALLKTTVLGLIGCLVNDSDRHRYRLEHKILKADGLGPWCSALEDALTGPASQFLLTDMSPEKNELTKLCGSNSWQYSAVTSLRMCLEELEIGAEDVPTQTDMKRWFYLFTTLRNKTRGHGATLPGKVAVASGYLKESVTLLYENCPLFKRPWAYLYRNLSGKYKISPITATCAAFEELKRTSDKSYPNGVYLFAGVPRQVPFLESDADLCDFFFPNGSFGKKTYECLSYATNNKKEGDGSSHLTPPGTLPKSETQGLCELAQLGNCFSNAPAMARDYIARLDLEKEIQRLTEDDRHPVITLLGRGGIGKTSLALKVLNQMSLGKRFEVMIWFSARDVDLQFSGPKPVQPHVVSPEGVSRFYVDLVVPDRIKEPGFKCRTFFESQLRECEIGSCLFVFDNFETTQNPEELFAWIDTHIRLPNKVLITTRLRDFKGDYPVEIGGMTESEAMELIHATANQLAISHLLDNEYCDELIKQADGHPYIIKILLGEVAREKRAGHIQRLVAGRDEILTALFERTYASLNPCAQRAFMTLSAWNSAVPRVALEAVLQKSTGELAEVECAIDILLQYSLVERKRSVDGMDFIELPLVSLMFGRRKLNVSPFLAAIKADAELLQMLGTVNRGEVYFSLAKRIEYFLGSIARRIEKGDTFEKYAPIIEMIGLHFPPAWLSLARLNMEDETLEGYDKAKMELRRYLEQDSTSVTAAEAWLNLAHCCLKTGDYLGEIHARVQRAKVPSTPFADLASTAHSFNGYLRRQVLEAGVDEKEVLGRDLLSALEKRMDEARGDDLGNMAWLALRLNEDAKAKSFVEIGLGLEPTNTHLLKLAQDLFISVLIASPPAQRVGL